MASSEMEFSMTYGVTIDGFVKKSLSDILDSIEDYQLENLSAALTRDRLSVSGHINTSNAQEISELWEVAQAVYTNLYPDGASGISLQYVAALTGTYLTSYSKTLVSALVTLNPFKNLPAGSVANLTGQPEIRFVSLTEVPADPVGGTFSVVFEAERAGAITVAIGQLNEIAEPVTGWVAVVNASPGSTGTEPETDPELRLKRELELSAQGSTNVDAIKANILQNTTTTDVVVLENDTDLVGANLLPPHHIWVIALDGNATELAEEIFRVKAAAVGTYGQQSETVTDTQNYDHDILFDWSVSVEIDVVMVFDILPGYDWPTVTASAVENVTNYIDSLRIGENVKYNAVLCSIINTEGVSDGSATVNGGTSDIIIEFNEKAIPGEIGTGA